MNKVQENPGDINLMSKFAKEITDCYTALLPSCGKELKSKIKMGLAQMKMKLTNCQAGDSDCNIMKCMSIMGNLQQQQQSGPTQETCKISKQANECFTEQKAKCQNNAEAKAQIELASVGIVTMSSACKTMIEEDEKNNQTKQKRETNKELTESVCSNVAYIASGFINYVFTEEPGPEDSGARGVVQIRQTPFLIMTSAITLLLRAMFN
ncbi:uncharacterized protein LOC131936703 isoform X2 [Physella acuta]|nr:uncharacterized protein LOC131936703 isoform X2 [Physella acuta]